MSAEIIRVDHQALEQVASKFGDQAQAVAQLLQALQKSYQPLKSGGWIGRGSTAFCAEMENKILPAVRRLAEALAQANRTTNEIRTIMRNADEEASSNFRNNDGPAGSGMDSAGVNSTSNGNAASALGAAGIGAAGLGGTGLSGAGGPGMGTDSAGASGAGISTGGAGSIDSGVGGGGAGSFDGGLGSSAGDSSASGLFDPLTSTWNDGAGSDLEGSGLGYSAEDNFFGGDPLSGGSFGGDLLGGGLGDGAGWGGSSFGPNGNDYGIPQDWLSGVTGAFNNSSGLNDYLGNGSSDYGIPQDWLDGVKDAVNEDLRAAQEHGAGGSGSGGDTGSGSGSGGGTGGGSGSGGGEPMAEKTPEKPSAATPTGGGGSGSGGGSPLQSNLGERSRGDFLPRNFSPASAGEGAKAVHQPKFHYQSASGLGGPSAAATDAPSPNFVLMGGSPAGGAATEASAPSGMPLLLAVASPFVALLGKAIKKKVEGG